MPVGGGPRPRVFKDKLTVSNKIRHTAKLTVSIRQLADEAQWWAGGVANPGDLIIEMIVS